MTDISGFGLSMSLTASKTFPQAITLTEVADDADPFDMPSVQIADKAMTMNGTLLTWSKANPKLVTINVVANSEDDKNLTVLAEANTPVKGKKPARDIITLVINYPDGRSTTCTGGAITDAMPTDGVASAGRLKTKPYMFAFENISRR